MEDLIFIRIADDPDFLNADHNIVIKNIKDGKLYIGNTTSIIDEIKTDKSNNWAKIFFYGNH